MSNSDPVTGQAGWYDVRVRVYKAEKDDDVSLPQFDPIEPVPGEQNKRVKWQAYFAGRKKGA
jgi:hypothetical protein